MGGVDLADDEEVGFFAGGGDLAFYVLEDGEVVFYAEGVD